MSGQRYLIATAEDILQQDLKRHIETDAPGSELYLVPNAFRITSMIGLSHPDLVAIDLALPELISRLEDIAAIARKSDCDVTFFSTNPIADHSTVARRYNSNLCVNPCGESLVKYILEHGKVTAFEPEVVRHTEEPPCSPSSSTEEVRLPSIDELLIKMLDMGGSDLHLSVGSAPRVRVLGELNEISGYAPLKDEDTAKIIAPIIGEHHMASFKTTGELDFSYSIAGRSRFRVNVFRQRNTTGAVLRTIPFEIPTFKELGLPDVCRELADRPRGLVLVTGPTGSGKSTTLAAMVNYINETKAVHIMTMEDPIEFVHSNKKALINQREVGEDTESFGSALKRVLRQDPDVILVGELRDLETISAAITAAETGHLVLGTLHTIGGPETIDRIIDVFPPDQQNQVRMQLSGALIGVMTQILCPTVDEHSRVMAQEIMIGVPAIGNLIREGKTHQMTSIIQSGAAAGMTTLDQSLRKLVNAKKITPQTALEKSQDPKTMAEQLGIKY